MPLLGDRHKRLLLQTARKSIIAAVEGKPPLTELSDEQDLRRPGGAFVTIRRGSQLRGCIGQIPGEEPLIELVARCAGLAALQDPRFRPVTPGELAGLQIEISVLSIPEDIAPQDIVAGTHGLLVSRDRDRGILLPQVATHFRWSALRFLEETCVKASLEPHAWKQSGTRVQAFTAQVFSEADFPAGETLQETYSIST